MINRVQQTRHTKHNPVDPEDYFNPVYQYSHKFKDWMFLGYKCVKCGSVYKRGTTLDNHPNTCRGTKSNYRLLKNIKDEDSPKILDKSRKLWQPYDFNQKLSNKNNKYVKK